MPLQSIHLVKVTFLINQYPIPFASCSNSTLNFSRNNVYYCRHINVEYLTPVYMIPICQNYSDGRYFDIIVFSIPVSRTWRNCRGQRWTLCPNRLHWSVVWNRRQLLDIVTCDIWRTVEVAGVMDIRRASSLFHRSFKTVVSGSHRHFNSMQPHKELWWLRPPDRRFLMG